MSDQHDWTVLLHLSLLRRICWDWPPCYQVAGRRGWWRRTARTEQTWRRPRTSARTRPLVLPRPRHPPHRWPSVSHTRNRKSELTRQISHSKHYRETRAGNNLYQELSFQDSDALADIDEGADLTGNGQTIFWPRFEINVAILLSRRVGAS